ncbi:MULTISPECIES: rcc01693 family protein [Rhodomicrobium]|uniref:rcc01693 family protein n=1 Tax=Rhodomicrobium TaxID=1068 RepID=UPI000B4BC462|nr:MULTISPECIES: rcc01693 family protein [Rhodomicrobium]
MTPFPWDDAIAAGLGVLRLAPAAFWSMTPRELRLALRGAAGLPGAASPFARADFADLMRRFPDS